MFTAFIARLRAFLRRDDLDRDFERELASHVAMLTEHNIARGMTPEDARRAALMRVGAGASLQDQHRAERGLPALESVLQDLRYALRSFARHPGFAGLVIVTLALGIGASTATFSLIDAVLIRSLPFPDSDRLGMIWEEAPRVGYPKTDVSPANYVDWTTQSDVFDDLAAYFGNAFNLTAQGRPERLDGVHVMPNLFSLLGIRPFLGRSFLPSEGTPGNAGVAILSHALWQRRFGDDVNVIGRSIVLNRQPHIVVGVMPKGFQFPREDTQLWTPVTFSTATRSSDRLAFGVTRRNRARRARRSGRSQLNDPRASQKRLARRLMVSSSPVAYASTKSRASASSRDHPLRPESILGLCYGSRRPAYSR